MRETYHNHSKQAPRQLGDVLILGLGKTGRAVYDYLRPLLGGRVRSLTIAAGDETADACAFADEATGEGVAVTFGQSVNGTFDLCIASPGISKYSPFYGEARAASAELISEVEFAWRESDACARWVAITGTNGKTTTTALTAALLCGAGLDAKAVGNIGDACIEAVASASPPQVYVAEVSSFQLASTEDFAPDVAVVLNITPDHLIWHGSLEDYAQSKWKILANLGSHEGAIAVLNATDGAVREKIRELKALTHEERGFDYVPLGTARGYEYDMRQACGSDNAAFVDEGRLHVALAGRDYDLVAVEELQLKGAHNLGNALAACTAALALGADPAAIACALKAFPPLEHRIEPAGVVAGVACYNDSKATNVDATLVAFEAFKPKRPIVLLGGRDKMTDLEPLVDAAEAFAKAVVLFGESRDRFTEAFFQRVGGAGRKGGPTGGAGSAFTTNAGLGVRLANHLEDALDAGLALAEPGDIVLLSPACASFDEFSCFEERGERFKAWVAARAAAAEASRRAGGA